MCIMFGKWKMMYNVVYEPRVEDPVVVATFSTLHKAEARVVGFASIINLTYRNSEDMKRELHITQEEINK